jgi:hypothetical protein
MKRFVPDRLRSALRFSQPLSGFLAPPCSAALSHAAAVPGILPSEPSPRRNRAPLSRPLAPSWSSTRVLNRAVRGLVAAGFPHSHALAQSPGSPVDYGLPFPVAVATRPGRPGHPSDGTDSFRQLHPPRSLVPPPSPFTSAEGCPPTHGRCSPGLSPLQSFLPPRLGTSLTRPSPKARARTVTRRPDPRPRGALAPWSQVRPPQDE